MNSKPILVYYSPDYYIDTDITVLCHLIEDFRVVWFYQYSSTNPNSMTYSPSKAKDYAEKWGITLEVADLRKRRRSPSNYFFYRRIAKKINKYEPSIVYACEVFPFWTYCYNKIHCKNKILGIHDVTLHSYKHKIIESILHRIQIQFIQKFNNIFTFSLNQQKLLRELYMKESSMVGMSCKNLGMSNLKAPVIKGSISLLYLGRIHLYKGLDLLINALEELADEGLSNIKLTIAGKGPFWNSCKDLIKHDALYNLHICFVPTEEIPDLMCSHHFLVLPYRDATQSGPLAIALNYSLPIIAPNFGCFKDIYNSKSGILYEKEELKKALKEASEISQSEYDLMKQETNKIKEKYSEKSIAENYIKAFKKSLLTMQ